MGWAMLGGMAAAAMLLLLVLRFPWRLWTIPATAVMLGAAGYAWQGRPLLAGRTAAAGSHPGRVDPALVELREAMFGKYGTYAWSYAVAADRMTMSGKPALAAAVWQGAVRKAPEDVALWTGFGGALAERDGNHVSPAAQFAFDRAMALYPKHPGPPFFYGLALIREGRFAEAAPWWRKALALTPDNASYRHAIELRVAALEVVLQAQAEEGADPRAGDARQGP